MSIKEEEKQVGAHVSAPVRVTLPLQLFGCMRACRPNLSRTPPHTRIHAPCLTLLGALQISNLIGNCAAFACIWKHLTHWWQPLSWWTLPSRHFAQYLYSVLLLLAYQTCMYILHTYPFCVKVFVCFFLYFELIFIMLRFAGKCRF